MLRGDRQTQDNAYQRRLEGAARRHRGGRDRRSGDKYFRLRYNEPLPVAWNKFADPNAVAQPGSLAYMLPGRVLARRTVTVPFRGTRKGQFYCLILIH